MDVKVNWIKLIWADKKKFIFIDWQFCCDSTPSIDGGPVSIGRWWDFHRRSSEFFSACSWLSSDSLFCYESNWPGLLLTFMGIRILWASTRRPSAQKSPPLVSIDTSRSARPPTAAERNAGVWFVTSVEERKKTTNGSGQTFGFPGDWSIESPRVSSGSQFACKFPLPDAVRWRSHRK